MSKIKIAVYGFGNIGKHAIDSILLTNDMECLGVIRREASLGKNSCALKGVEEFSSLEKLCAKKSKPDVVIVSSPSRQVPVDAEKFLSLGINTVDSFDIHTDITSLINKLEPVAKASNTVSISAAGWDPGTDSVMRALFEAMTPTGSTFTNFGRGRSMGHSVAARAITGVEDAVAITIPVGGGRHSRLVYVLAQAGTAFEKIKQDIANDPYFTHDPLEIKQVHTAFELARVADNSHGVLLERVGASGSTSNQKLVFDMRIDNPALTAQVLVSCARATTRISSGAYTLIDVPLVALLPGSRMDNIARLV